MSSIEGHRKGITNHLCIMDGGAARIDDHCCCIEGHLCERLIGYAPSTTLNKSSKVINSVSKNDFSASSYLCSTKTVIRALAKDGDKPSKTIAAA